MAEKRLHTDQDGQAPRKKTQQEVKDFAKAVAAILGQDFLDKPLADYATRVLAAIDQKPPEMNTAYWGSLLKEAATRLSIPFDAESFAAQITTLSSSEDTNPNGPTPSVAGFGTFLTGPDPKPNHEPYDQEETSGEIDLATEIGQRLGVIYLQVDNIANKTRWESLDRKQLARLKSKLNALHSELVTLDNLVEEIPTLTTDAKRFRQVMYGTILELIETGEYLVHKHLEAKIKTDLTDSTGPIEMKNVATTRTKPALERQRGLPTPPKKKNKRPKFKRTKGKDGK